MSREVTFTYLISLGGHASLYLLELAWFVGSVNSFLWTHWEFCWSQSKLLIGESLYCYVIFFVVFFLIAQQQIP